VNRSPLGLTYAIRLTSPTSPPFSTFGRWLETAGVGVIELEQAPAKVISNPDSPKNTLVEFPS